jgi:hypothetical protein
MKTQNYQTTIEADSTEQHAFNCINQVTKWWTENLEGSSSKLNDEFTVRFGDVHVSTQKLVEFIPNKKIVWLVTDSSLNFTRDKQEWTGTKIHFEISGNGGKTQVRFIHEGLEPEIECFDACSNAWGEYIHESLLDLINDGKGRPTKKQTKPESIKK